MSDYEVIFGLDCVGGDQAPIDCAVVKTSDGKPGIMLDGEVFTKESLTPEPAGERKIPLIIEGSRQYFPAIKINGEYFTGFKGKVSDTTTQSYVMAYIKAGDVISLDSESTRYWYLNDYANNDLPYADMIPHFDVETDYPEFADEFNFAIWDEDEETIIGYKETLTITKQLVDTFDMLFMFMATKE